MSVIGITRADAPAAVREARLYGGQAVIEGVLMKSASRAVVSVRESVPYVKNARGKWVDPTQEWSEAEREAAERQRKIVSRELWRVEGAPRKSWKQLPLIRGVFVLFESLSLGMKALEFSAQIAGESTEEQQAEPTLWQKILSYGLSIGFAILLFHFLPNLIAEGAGNALHLPAKGQVVDPFSAPAMTKNLIDGVVRILFFALYILIIRSLFKEIYRVFQYHGAEHKTVNAYEAFQPLTVESVQRMPTYHRRCGTSFVFLVAMVSILLHIVTGWHPNIGLRILRNLLLLLPVAAVSYELLRLTAAHPDVWWSRIIALPGIGFQKITALEPTDNMVAVSVDAFKQVMEDAQASEESAEAASPQELVPALAAE